VARISNVLEIPQRPMSARFQSAQPSMRNGKNGANGPNVQLFVDRVPKSGPEHAVNLPLEATSSVVEIQQRPGSVAQLNAQATRPQLMSTSLTLHSHFPTSRSWWVVAVATQA